MAKRRANGEGSIFHRKDGRWSAQITLFGKRITKYGKTQKECSLWLKQMITKIDGGLSYEGAQMTLGNYAELWLSGKELSRRVSTVDGYRRNLELYVLPALSKVRLQNILPIHIRQIYLRMQIEGRGRRTIELVHVTLHALFAQALKEGLVVRNPLDAVERPRAETQQFQILTEAQARQFLVASAGSPYETIFYLALITGMRKGELLGLQWSDIDWEKGVLFVKRQLHQASARSAVLAPPKTKAGIRAIKVGQGTLDQLEAHRERQELLKKAAGDRWQEQDLVFTSSIGTFLDQSRVSKEFKRILAKAGLPDIRFHDLRHTSISLLLGMNIPVNAVQMRAGHSKPSVTVDIYGHTIARIQEAAANKIEELIIPTPDNSTK